MLTRLANPRRFMAITRPLLPWLGAISLLALLAGLYLALVASPADYLQGEMVRLMYLHVPCAWLALGAYGYVALSSAYFLAWKHPMADVMAHEAAVIGAVFAFLTLITGSLWGRPAWGVWWAWDARLTSMLILFFFYLGYLAVSTGTSRDPVTRRISAIVALVGAVWLPVIKFSVEWWHTLHQPASLLRLSGPAIDPAMLKPLLVMAFAFLCLFIWLLLLLVHARLLESRQSRPISSVPAYRRTP